MLPLIVTDSTRRFEAVDLFELGFERLLAPSRSRVQSRDVRRGEVFVADLLRFQRRGVALQVRHGLGDLCCSPLNELVETVVPHAATPTASRGAHSR